MGSCERKDSEDPRWHPDDQLVPAILAGGRKRMGELCDSDRSWVVAGLTLAGLTAEDIAHRLGCSLRLVRSIRAQDMTLVCKSMQTESENFTGEVRLVRSQLRATQQELTETAAFVDTYHGTQNVYYISDTRDIIELRWMPF